MQRDSVVAWQFSASLRLARGATHDGYCAALARFLFTDESEVIAQAARLELDALLVPDARVAGLLTAARAVTLGRWSEVRLTTAPFCTRGTDEPLDDVFLWHVIYAYCASLRLGDTANERTLELLVLRTGDALGTQMAAACVVDAVRRGDLGGQCVCFLMLARVRILQRNLREARAHARTSLALAEEHGFRKAGLRAQVCLAGIEFLQGNRRACEDTLKGARARAEELGLPVQMLCVRVALALTKGGGFSGNALAEYVQAPSGLSEATHLLRFYGFLEDASLVLESLSAGNSAGDGVRVHVLESGVARLRSMGALACFEESDFLVAFTHEKAFLVRLGKGAKSGASDVETLLRFVFKRKDPFEPVPSETIHALFYPDLAYRETAHRARVQALVSRVRRRLTGTGVELRYEASARAYALASARPFFRARVEAATPRVGTEKLSPREKEILAFLGDERRVETSRLCEHFGCTRQTLHPMLKKLEVLGLVEMRRKGPLSVYLLAAQ